VGRKDIPSQEALVSSGGWGCPEVEQWGRDSLCPLFLTPLFLSSIHFPQLGSSLFSMPHLQGLHPTFPFLVPGKTNQSHSVRGILSTKTDQDMVCAPWTPDAVPSQGQGSFTQSQSPETCLSLGIFILEAGGLVCGIDGEKAVPEATRVLQEAIWGPGRVGECAVGKRALPGEVTKTQNLIFVICEMKMPPRSSHPIPSK
jgi:hypothetical protein